MRHVYINIVFKIISKSEKMDLEKKIKPLSITLWKIAHLTHFKHFFGLLRPISGPLGSKFGGQTVRSN